MITKTIQKETRSPEATQELGRYIGTSITTASMLALTGDLGSGKTVFVQGLAEGLGVPDDYYITSPTFTLINRYPGRFTLFHVDLYRIENSDEMEDIGLFEILNGDGVVAVEWADKLKTYLPSEHVALHFEIKSDESRSVSVIGYGPNNFELLTKLDDFIPD